MYQDKKKILALGFLSNLMLTIFIFFLILFITFSEKQLHYLDGGWQFVLTLCIIYYSLFNYLIFIIYKFLLIKNAKLGFSKKIIFIFFTMLFYFLIYKKENLNLSLNVKNKKIILIAYAAIVFIVFGILMGVLFIGILKIGLFVLQIPFHFTIFPAAISVLIISILEYSSSSKEKSKIKKVVDNKI
ncbi:hypothetical protein ACXX84_01950 [Mycoplasma sp. AC157]|uniref:hypothetical protein n=1 Tax=Mycoplasma sp. 480 TaxID=3440155 RepID=UPI003F51AAAF